MSLDDYLFKMAASEYGEEYQTHLLEQYKLFVESADRISQRRLHANSFFLTINTAFLAAFGAIVSHGSQPLELWWVPLITLVGLVLCFVWYRVVLSYKGLNEGKFAVIHRIEERLPLSIFGAEWRYIGEGKNPKRYRPFSDIETWIPRIFAALYGVLIVAFGIKWWWIS